jgi:hypothetical protein
VRRLERALKRGAFEQGYAGDYWTLDRIAHLIWDLLEVRYHPSNVWHIGYFCPSPRKGKNKGRLFNDEVCLRCYPQLVPEKIIGHRWAMLILGLLNFAVFVGMQQELHLFQPLRCLNRLTRRSIVQCG